MAALPHDYRSGIAYIDAVIEILLVPAPMASSSTSDGCSTSASTRGITTGPRHDER
jgi:hypothetical protein